MKKKKLSMDVPVFDENDLIVVKDLCKEYKNLLNILNSPFLQKFSYKTQVFWCTNC